MCPSFQAAAHENGHTTTRQTYSKCPHAKVAANNADYYEQQRRRRQRVGSSSVHQASLLVWKAGNTASLSVLVSHFLFRPVSSSSPRGPRHPRVSVRSFLWTRPKRASLCSTATTRPRQPASNGARKQMRVACLIEPFALSLCLCLLLAQHAAASFHHCTERVEIEARALNTTLSYSLGAPHPRPT